MSENGNRIISSLCYKDATAAIAWLEQAFGFTPHMVVPGEQEGDVRHSQIIAPDGRSMIMLFTVREEDGFANSQNPPSVLGGSNQSLYLVVDEVEAHYARAKAAGAETVMPPTAQDYGGSCYTIRDPEGHIWSFGDYDPWRSCIK
ncbi:MAG: VOC family protein [Planctomycetota bacterium]